MARSTVRFPICLCLSSVLLLDGAIGCTQPPAPAGIAPDGPGPAATAVRCTAEDVRAVVERELAGLAERNPIPGAVSAVLLPALGPDPISVAVGLSDLESRRPMNSQDRFLMGSVGKTLYAAAALKLATEGKLDLDAPISSYLPANAVPDSDNVTSRMLLGHRSGYPTYDEEFIVDLIRDPLRIRRLADWTGPIRRSPKSAAPDTEFVYSDVNYVVLAAVIEGATGHPAYAVIRRLLLQPLGLGDIVPADTVRIERLVPGYEGPDGLFKTDKIMGPQGLVFNPQFESGGGGFASTPADLARWIVALRLSTAIPAESWRLMSTPTSTTEDGQYGLGIHVDQSAIGRAYGHSGYIPGYLAWLRWYEDAGFAVAVQTNTSDNARFKEGGYAFLDRLARSVAQSCALLSP